jgi:hypothetical protein
MKLTPWILAAFSVGLIVHILQAKKQRYVHVSGALPEVLEPISGLGSEVQSHGDTGRLEVDEVIHQLADEITVVGGRTAQIVQHEIDDLAR